MAVAVDYMNRVISIEKVDMTLVRSTPLEVYELDVDAFRLKLKDIEDDIRGMPFVDTHFHSTAVTAEGVIVARVFEIINGYTVTFEDGNYTVNLISANNNIAEVTNLNKVQVRNDPALGLAQLSIFE